MLSTVCVAVVDIRIVRMGVKHWLVSMPMGMRCGICDGRVARCMDVLVMLVVKVRVVMLQGVVSVLMLMPFSKV